MPSIIARKIFFFNILVALRILEGGKIVINFLPLDFFRISRVTLEKIYSLQKVSDSKYKNRLYFSKSFHL